MEVPKSLTQSLSKKRLKISASTQDLMLKHRKKTLSMQPDLKASPAPKASTHMNTRNYKPGPIKASESRKRVNRSFNQSMLNQTLLDVSSHIRYPSRAPAISNKLPALPLGKFDPYIDPNSGRLHVSKGRCKGESKWFFTDGSFEWRVCDVLDYSDEKYLIEWPNGKQKLVSRINLKFPEDNEFDQRLVKAEELRMITELVISYRACIEQMPTTIPEFPLRMIQEILNFLQNRTFRHSPVPPTSAVDIPEPMRFNSHLLVKVWKKEKTHMIEMTPLCARFKVETPKEVKDIYFNRLEDIKIQCGGKIIGVPSHKIRVFFDEIEPMFAFAVRQFDFEADLAVNEEKKRIFGQILSAEKLQHPALRGRFATNRIGVIEKLDYNFEKRLWSIQQKLHQAHMGSLQVLQKLKIQLLNFTNFIWFCNVYPFPYELSNFRRIQEIEIKDVVRNLKNCMFDIQYEIQDIVNHANMERLQRNEEKMREKILESQEIDIEKNLNSKFVKRMSGLIEVCNSMVELELLEGLDRSFLVLLHQLESLVLENNEEEAFFDVISCFCRFYPSNLPALKAKVVYDATEKKFKLDPDLEQLKTIFQEILLHPLTQLRHLPALSVPEIPQRRANCTLKLSEDHVQFESKLEKVFRLLDKLWELPTRLLKELEAFAFILKAKPDRVRAKYTHRFDGNKLLELHNNFFRAHDNIDYLFRKKKELDVGLFVIRVDDIRKQLEDICRAMIDSIKYVITTTLSKQIDSLNYQDEEIMEILGNDPQNLEELSEIKQFIQKQSPGRLGGIMDELRSLTDLLELIEDCELKLTAEQLHKAWGLYGIPRRIKKKMLDCGTMIVEKEELFSQQLQVSLKALLAEIEELKEILQNIKRENELKKYEDMSLLCLEFRSRLNTAIENGKTVNGRQAILRLDLTDFKILEVLKKEFAHFDKLWNNIRDFSNMKPHWVQKCSVHELNSNEIFNTHEEYKRDIGKMVNSAFKSPGFEEALALAQTFKRKLEKFQPKVPLIQHLKNPGMKERHWEYLQKVTGIPALNRNLACTLKDLLNENILEKMDKIEEISEKANKELVLEQQKAKMESEWENIAFALQPTKSVSFMVISEPEPIQELIDDHLMKTSSMLNSPFIEYFIKNITAWKNQLLKMQDIINQWLGVQNSWLYLYPLFQNKDIKAQLPAAASKFSSVHEYFEQLMLQLQRTPLVTEMCTYSPKLLEQLKSASENLAVITKSLNEYLNVKRKDFPRFYFLSDDELLKIMSNSKDVKMIYTFIDKCFEGMEDLNFRDKEIIQMKSPEGEEVSLVNPVNLMNEEGEFKYVEEWMNDLEEEMKSSMHLHMNKCFESYFESERISWIKNWASQLVHTVSLIHWTFKSEEAILSGELREHSNNLKSALDQLVEVVREPLDSLTRMTISTLVVIDVHNRDIVSNLIEARVGAISEFEWLSQLRYYLENSTVKISMIDTERQYGYEYIGNQMRLVMTELTDRCYRTLMSALRLNLGGAPEGPAGTGKTETTKDLSKTIANKCIVFNCSDRLDHEAMAKLFRGLVRCGAWACFDEFNRIETEVLSVIAEQILVIQAALMTKSKKFNFEGENIPLNPDCAIFITMNPTYAGRSTLPDNLKALFRPVAMMIPNYWMIAEIYLYSFGFKSARNLSVKLITSLRLASEQLSSQAHYDYGLRTVITIIKTAGIYKRADNQSNEDELLLRALYDANVPKFLAKDIELFKGITSDLFPSTIITQRATQNLESYIKQAMTDMELIPDDRIVKKIIQLHDLLLMRHGVMIIGLPFSCKSTCIKVLIKSLILKNIKEEGESKKPFVEFTWIFPKSITLEQLYGDIDKSSKEWMDGILSHYLRNYSQDIAKNKKWIVFDGPVDSVWIETMNTVLDDNKKLCLTSGEIIKMTSEMAMVFEVDSLSAASPATISRVAMIYANSDDIIDPYVLLECWLQKVPKGYHFETTKNTIRFAFEHIFVPCLVFVDKNGIVAQSFTKYWLTINFLKIFECVLLKNAKSKTKHEEEYSTQLQKFLKEMEEKKNEPVSPGNRQSSMKRQGTMKGKKDAARYKFCLQEEQLADKDLQDLTSFFIFATVWSLGSVTTEGGRNKFDSYLRSIVFEFDELRKAYHDQNCYSMLFNSENNEWEAWKLEELNLIGRTDIDINSIHVPTSDTAATSHILRTIITKNIPIAVIGKTGTGKSVQIKKILNVIKEENDKALSYSYTFSPRSNPTQLQEMIATKLVKRRTSTYGPETSKTLFILIDDLHMPSCEPETGAQPPNELVRQMIDRQEWFVRQNCDLNYLEDIVYVAMADSKNEVSVRLMRHLFLINFTEFSHESLKHIFGSYLSLGFQNHSKLVSKYIDTLTEGTILIYKKTVEKLPPTPAKSHYQFNLRDISNIFRGMTSVPVNSLNDQRSINKLWLHECLRTFSDRLVDEADQEAFENIMDESLNKMAGTRVRLLRDRNFLMYCNFVDKRIYQECVSMQEAKDSLENALSDYNASKDNKQMDLEIFDFAIFHIARICRILSTPMGNGLLIGMGGIGRLSLSKLAAASIGGTICQIFPTKTYGEFEWAEDLKKVMYKAGVEGKMIAFLFRETDLKNETFLENINNLLNSGEIPNLHTREDKETIAGSMKDQQRGQLKNTDEKYEDFIVHVRNNLHIIMCFSPIGEALRKRLRSFPSLVTCCTINWMTDWPHEALVSLATKNIQQSELSSSPEQAQEIMEICVKFHQTVQALSQDYYNERRRVNYVTPFNYLNLFTTIQSLYKYKEDTSIRMKKKYLKGVSMLEKAKVDIKKLSEELTEKKPVLEEETKKTEEIMADIQLKNVKADKTRTLMAREEEICENEAKIAEGIEQECEEALAKTVPILQNAIKALETLDKKDLATVKSMQNPPKPIRIVIEAVVILNSRPPQKMQDPNDTTRFYYSYWEAGKKMMQNTSFLRILLGFEKEKITQEIIDKLKPYIMDPRFVPEIVRKSSSAAEGLCKWVRAMDHYYFISNDIKPKEAALTEAKVRMEEKRQILNKKRDQLRSIEESIEALEAEFNKQNEVKIVLEKDINMCSVKLERAQRLMEKLGGEKDRWEEKVEQMTKDLENIMGDILLSAGVVSYLGNFTGEYRTRIVQNEWIPFVTQTSISCSSEFALREVVGKPIEIQHWNICGLPNDSVSIENAIILHTNTNLPLMIDPQNQANKWIKKMNKGDKFQVCQPNSSDFSKILENAMSNGTSLMLENVSEDLDPALDPLLNKAFFLEGNSVNIKVGDSLKPYDKRFRLYMTTTLPKPSFTPEIASQTTLLDFSITQLALAEQLLALVSMKELPSETEELNKLVSMSVEYNKNLQDCEDNILALLEGAGEQILDDEILVNSLTQSKKVSEEVERELKTVKSHEKRIIEFQEAYNPVSDISSVLYFCTADMANIDPMYIFSMEWFMSVFTASLETATQSKSLDVRIQNLIENFRQTLFNKIVMSLFERDKLMFSFIMSMRLMQHTIGVDPLEWKFLLTGFTGNSEDEKGQPENPIKSTIDDKLWREVCEVSQFSGLQGVKEAIIENPEVWKNFIIQALNLNVLTDFDTFTNIIPPPFNDPGAVSPMQRLCLLRATRPEDMMQAITSFVFSQIGEFYLKPPLLELSDVLEISTPLIPLIFILTPGNDPQSKLAKFAHENHQELVTISLGKGQGVKATRHIRENIRYGGWVLLQNCHLALSWLSQLENLLEEYSTKEVHPHFRIWLTTLSHPRFPVTILHGGLKIITEAPKGLKLNLKGLYRSLASSKEDSLLFYESSKPQEWRKLLFALCFFHCSIRERRKFGSLGWNSYYEFTDSDFSISMKQLKLLIEENDTIPLKALRYLASECNYGGKVTDDWDRRTLNQALEDFYDEKILDDSHCINGLPAYQCPPHMDTIEEYLDFIEALPFEENPEVYGMHANANITYARKATGDFFQRILDLQPGSISNTESLQSSVTLILEEILTVLPKLFDLEKALKENPPIYEQSLNIVLLQELGRFNNLIVMINEKIQDLLKAFKGAQLMNRELEEMLDSIQINRVPNVWLKVSFATCKPLSSWVQDIVKRARFFNKWLDSGLPKVFWVTSFFFTQAFFTAILQNEARTNPSKPEIDSLKFQFTIRPDIEIDEDSNIIGNSSAEHGTFISGLFIEGATWNAEKKSLDDPKPRILFSSMPVIHIVPIINLQKPSNTYTCPVYKTIERKGELSTTGHSTNYIFTIYLPTDKPESYWVKRGVALITQLND